MAEAQIPTTPNVPLQSHKQKPSSDNQRLSTILQASPPEEVHDLICVGFGPASLAIAIALQDTLKGCRHSTWIPKVAFLEKQDQFSWHAGMLLPDAKMQISFVKDLATLRDPCSPFTFLNYLKQHDRLVQFSNLDTFLPSRLEFEDYMRWCSSHFSNVVRYRQEVTAVNPSKSTDKQEKYNQLSVVARDTATGQVLTLRTRNVVIAVGGTPQTPQVFQGLGERLLHCSAYVHDISKLLPVRDKKYSVAVIGGGQSAAEVFDDLHGRYPNASTTLIFRGTALRPSDDSPFVNEIFNSNAIDTFYCHSDTRRKTLLAENRSTNYSVVRESLLHRIYETLYEQSVKEPNEDKRNHRILPQREVIEAAWIPANKRINLKLEVMDPISIKTQEIHGFDAVVLGTGYVRDSHLHLLNNCQVLNDSKDKSWTIGRDYKVRMDSRVAADDMGIWLQGCNESTHGLSDSLLSVLATRSGELVNSIFKKHMDV